MPAAQLREPSGPTPGATSPRSSNAATDCLARDPETSVAGIAAAAGVGRITLYGHFKTRADLVENAVLVRTVRRADADPGRHRHRRRPGEALARLVASSWLSVHQFRNILLAAQRELPCGAHPRRPRPDPASRASPSSDAGTARRRPSAATCRSNG